MDRLEDWRRAVSWELGVVYPVFCFLLRDLMVSCWITHFSLIASFNASRPKEIIPTLRLFMVDFTSKFVFSLGKLALPRMFFQAHLPESTYINPNFDMFPPWHPKTDLGVCTAMTFSTVRWFSLFSSPCLTPDYKSNTCSFTYIYIYIYVTYIYINIERHF